MTLGFGILVCLVYGMLVVVPLFLYFTRQRLYEKTNKEQLRPQPAHPQQLIRLVQALATTQAPQPNTGCLRPYRVDSGCLRPSYVVGLLLPVVFIIAIMTTPFWWAAGWTLAFLGYGWFLNIRLMNYGDHLYAGLKRSCFMMRLAQGPQELEEIYRGTPSVFGWLLAGPRPRSFVGWARLAVVNIDWYAFPGHSLLARALKNTFLVLIPLAISYAYAMYVATSHNPNTAGFAAMGHLLPVFILVGQHTTAIQNTRAATLLRYLKNEMPES